MNQEARSGQVNLGVRGERPRETRESSTWHRTASRLEDLGGGTQGRKMLGRVKNHLYFLRWPRAKDGPGSITPGESMSLLVKCGDCPHSQRDSVGTTFQGMAVLWSLAHDEVLPYSMDDLT